MNWPSIRRWTMQLIRRFLFSFASGTGMVAGVFIMLQVLGLSMQHFGLDQRASKPAECNCEKTDAYYHPLDEVRR